MKNKILTHFENKNSSKKFPPYFIAEIGINHEGSLERAKSLIKDAKEGGADAVKFQTLKPETLFIEGSEGYNIFKKYSTFWKNEFRELKEYADFLGLDFLSTPFGFEEADILVDLVPAFKIASCDIDNKPFLEYIAKLKKPIIISTGGSKIWEIERAIDWISKYNSQICIMHSVMIYPAPRNSLNLHRIEILKEKFPEHIIGYSDHAIDKSPDILGTAYLLGATIIEKHFTYDNTLNHLDHPHSYTKKELKEFKNFITQILSALYTTPENIKKEEEIARLSRRSIRAKQHIKKGKTLEESDISYKRPQDGIPPYEIENIIGKKASKNIERDQLILHRDLY